MSAFSTTAQTPDALATAREADVYHIFADALADGVYLTAERTGDTDLWTIYDGERYSMAEVARMREASALTSYPSHGEACDTCGREAIAIVDYSGALTCGECAS